ARRTPPGSSKKRCAACCRRRSSEAPCTGSSRSTSRATIPTPPRNLHRSRLPNLATTQYYGTGRRKTSTARVFLRPGSGTITVNSQPVEASFPTESQRLLIRQPLVATETGERFDVLATTAGGGVVGQAG